MVAQTQVVVVDDDVFKREGMSQRLSATGEIVVVDAVDQDTAAQWPRERWEWLDTVVVDVLDDRALGERGTDLYSGINVIERVQRLPVRCVAITPTCAHPLVQLRLMQATPDFLYHRWQLASPDDLREAVRFPDRTHKVKPPDRTVLERLGAARFLANDAVRTYLGSALYPHLRADISLDQLKRLGAPRRKVDDFKSAIVKHGYVSHLDADHGKNAPRRGEARWPEVRDLVLALLGRRDAPPTEFDLPWWW